MCGFGLLCGGVVVHNFIEQDTLIEEQDTKPTTDSEVPETETLVESEAQTESSVDELISTWSSSLRRRGPDSFQTVQFPIGLGGVDANNAAAGVNLDKVDVSSPFFWGAGAVLHIRGPVPQAQPLVDQGNFLLFNGEVFGGLEVAEHQNDTLALWNCLLECSAPSSVQETMKRLRGPWAFAFYQKKTSTLYFGRDPVGRRSLLISYKKNNLALSSVFLDDPYFSWNEVDTHGIYSIQFSETESASGVMQLLPWDKSETLPKRDTLPTETLDSKSVEVQELWKKYSEGLYDALFRSVQLRVINRPPFLGSVGILFSGGVDSAVIAAMAGLSLPPDDPIDLINVAFSLTGNDYHTSSDRKLARTAWENLCRVQPDRIWNFVEVNIISETLQEWKPHIASVMLPQNTLMDITISAAIWFASRSEGVLNQYDPTEKTFHTSEELYKSRAKILLVGHGADEQLGGYGRHLTAWTKGGWNRLQEELEKDIYRIWKRNLGRDDRIISDLGKEARHPFLDEDFIKYVASVPLDFISDYSEARGIGDKKILRLASERLGLSTSSKAPKKAIQFGTNIAKQFPKTRNTKGTDSFL
eukprot:TRINITY_DN759_c3_g1_i1.p1 TRINITY_DN759_c3_g1~~TRINITY_DN759_c3_g1_i1.p1  ORF type:complete len:585 (+),score=113.26 TRINITY_DN759_c3_g1_i1:274-2028(+)